MKIAAATELDLEQIYPHTGDSFTEGTLGQYEVDDKEASQMMKKVIEKDGRVLVVKDADLVAGWVLYGVQKDDITGEDLGFIYDVHVFSKYRKQGHAEALMKEALQELKNTGLRNARLVVYKGNVALDLYEKLGFKQNRVVMSMEL